MACFFIYFQLKHAKKLKEKNAEIAAHSKDLADLNAQKNKLFSILSHDLRSPLGNLNNLLDMQNEGDLSKGEFQKFIPIVSDSLKSVTATLENLLSWTKIGMGNGIKMQATFIDVAPVLEQVLFQSQPILEAKNIQVVINNKMNGQVWADPSFLVIILRNLLGNAIKFSHRDKEIVIEVEQKPGNSNMAVIRVIDQGVGMPYEVVQNVFSVNDNYTRSHGTSGEQGSGLGLIISKEFTEAMGGRIYANSIPEVGSTFYIELSSKLFN